ncbi:hypothetical protein GGU10DRAFT_278553 [Lentinula aff. detonsa]|uniref:CCHC-type domain-containing protein n=2 Tax=Lentinula TaxID=5352 RepID=A0AA38KDI3_9AGAR|nr:hypothetical protein GGU10DRAFT_278553 [Lentinula aff. detonsa]KAJ3979195.1 hypothetical protein F5890DRAFT_1421695 [Lentinula detonsa]
MDYLEKQLQTSANAVKAPDKNCNNCKRIGHIAEECFRKGGGKEGQYPSWWKGKKDAGGPSANVTTTPEVGELTQHYGLAALAEGVSEGEVFADTGASDHFFP